jgi:hypothetical protein
LKVTFSLSGDGSRYRGVTERVLCFLKQRTTL